jgi:two-component system, OmpR family, response regulator MprA
MKGVASMALPRTTVRERLTVVQENDLRVLIVEDEGRATSLLQHLQLKGDFGAKVTYDPGNALTLAGSGSYEVVMLQVPMRGADASELCRQMRAAGVVIPILLLAKRGSVDQIVAALNAGADDFMVEPIGTEPLMARLRTFKRRSTR